MVVVPWQPLSGQKCWSAANKISKDCPDLVVPFRDWRFSRDLSGSWSRSRESWNQRDSRNRDKNLGDNPSTKSRGTRNHRDGQDTGRDSLAISCPAPGCLVALSPGYGPNPGDLRDRDPDKIHGQSRFVPAVLVTCVTGTGTEVCGTNGTLTKNTGLSRPVPCQALDLNIQNTILPFSSHNVIKTFQNIFSYESLRNWH